MMAERSATSDIDRAPAVEENPYRSPSELSLERPLRPPAVQVGGRMGIDRFLAAQIDHAFSIVLFLAVAMNSAAIAGDIIAGLASVGAYLSYYFVPEWLFGATIGKACFSLRVRQLSGARCSAGQAAIRTALRFVEVNPLFLGALPAGIAILATQRRQRLGDLLAGTAVIRRSDLDKKSTAASVRVVRRKR